jgi:ketosteroid isomerase-like protein
MTNTDIVKGMYEAFGRGDIEGILNKLADDVEWLSSPESKTIPTGGTFRGRAGVAKFFQKVAENIEFEAFMPEKYIEQGDTVVALGSYSGRSKTLNKKFASPWAMVFTLRGGKLARFDEHFDTEAVADAFVSSSQAARP